MWLLVYSNNPYDFYKGNIESVWKKGRRLQKSVKEFNCKKEGYEIVPYYEFDTEQKHVMVYPVELFENKLDLPVFIKSIPKYPGVEVIGVGYAIFDLFDSDTVCYWDLGKDKQRLVKKTLERDFR